jgi:hypothetical protein
MPWRLQPVIHADATLRAALDRHDIEGEVVVSGW